MPHITRKLLRKRSEHNEGIITTLEEVTLHQEELEGINEVLGATCRKLKILYLQNNLIWKMENLHHLKDLEYLNLALNNISAVEGLQNCEFLYKLDLTVNFVDLDELEASMDHLSGRERLRDLYMMGNPCTLWPGFVSYAIARLPGLQTLDGTEVTRSMQITARQQLAHLEAELRPLAEEKRREKATKAAAAAAAAAAGGKAEPKPRWRPASSSSRVQELDENDEVIVEDDDGDDDDEEEDEEERQKRKDAELTENTPEARTEIYRELAQQKKEKEDRERAQQPRERDYEQEQRAALAETRQKEVATGEAEVRQRNEGGWAFTWDEDSRPGFVVLDVGVPRHLDSSLIDVDVHPSYVSIVIKSKVLRLRQPAEVRASESRCQRSRATGHLLVIMPKVNPRENAVTSRGTARHLEAERARAQAAKPAVARKLTLQEQAMQALDEARSATATTTLLGGGAVSSAVDFRGIVKHKADGDRDREGTEVGSVFDAGLAGAGSDGRKALVEELD